MNVLAQLSGEKWTDITGSFDQRNESLALERKGLAVVRRLNNGWFARLTSKGVAAATEKFSHKVTAAEIIEHERARGHKPPKFFVDLTDTTTRKCYGIQYVEPEPTRIMGAWGERTVRFTEPFEVVRGHRLVQFKASAVKPIVATEHLQFSKGA